MRLNMHYKQIKQKYIVYSEFRLHPLEIFNNKTDAADYILGFNRQIVKDQTGAYLKGLEYRRWIDLDIEDGWEFKRYNELDEVMNFAG